MSVLGYGSPASRCRLAAVLFTLVVYFGVVALNKSVLGVYWWIISQSVSGIPGGEAKQCYGYRLIIIVCCVWQHVRAVLCESEPVVGSWFVSLQIFQVGGDVRGGQPATDSNETCW